MWGKNPDPSPTSVSLPSQPAREFAVKRTKKEDQKQNSKAQAVTTQSRPREGTRRADQESRLMERETSVAPEKQTLTIQSRTRTIPKDSHSHFNDWTKPQRHCQHQL